MSHANGAIRFKDGTVMHFEYNGTVDMAISILYETQDEMLENWKVDQVHILQSGHFPALSMPETLAEVML